MTYAVISGADTTTGNVGALPNVGLVAGYVTGPGIAWTAAQWAAHPNAVRIAQSPVIATDEAANADVLDVENLAATFADCGPWALAAMAAWKAGVRPGQRWPAIYASQSNLTPVCNALAAAKITGVGLWVANWSDSYTAACQMLQASSGPYPVIGVQYANAGAYDLDVFLASWATYKSVAPAPKAQVPPGQWLNPAAWEWKDAQVTGHGMNGQMYTFTLDTATGTWAKS